MKKPRPQGWENKLAKELAPLCRDCRWMIECYCGHPDRGRCSHVDNVRLTGEGCGPEGKLFEPKRSVLQRFFNRVWSK